MQVCLQLTENGPRLSFNNIVYGLTGNIMIIIINPKIITHMSS